MNAVMHCRISQRRWGGREQDYYAIHDFIDSTKTLCSDGRHRVLHTLWGVKYVVIPVFGHTLTNADGKQADVKDLCERDHLLVDYHKKFIPTLNDFVSAMDETEIPDFSKRVERFHRDHVHDPALSDIMLSPLAATGQLKSLLLTHNSWFINHVIPKISRQTPFLGDFDLNPASFFNAMRFEYWMDNGMDYPPSARKMQRLITTENDYD